MSMGSSAKLPKFRLKATGVGFENRSVTGNVFAVAVLLAVGFFMVLPIVYIVVNAFKPYGEMFVFPPRFLVKHPTLDNFSNLFQFMEYSSVPFLRYVFNTVAAAAVAVPGGVLTCSLAAYALAKHDFPGSKLIFRVIVLALMFSPSAMVVPTYLVMRNFHLIDSMWSMSVLTLQFSLGLYLMKQFMDGIPDALLESARLDGANEFYIFTRIAMPIVKPAWLTVGIFCLQKVWNDPNIYVYSEAGKPLPALLNTFLAGGMARTGIASASSLLLLIVPVATFILVQSNVIETMSTSGIKE